MPGSIGEANLNVTTASWDSALLRLPSELRNRIYDFCKEDSAIILHRKGLPLLKDYSPESGCADKCDCKTSMSHHLTLTKPTFFHFMQTCRQVRSEFLPIYLERTQVAVGPWDLDHGYLPTFLTPPGTEVEHAIGNLVFIVKVRDEPHDIMPVVRLAQQAKRVHASMAYSDAFLLNYDHQYMVFMNKFFSPETEPAFHRFLQDAVEKIEVSVDQEPPFIYFLLYIREGWYTDWMDDWSGWNRLVEPMTRRTENCMMQWVDNCGLDVRIECWQPGWSISFRPLDER